MSRLREPEPVAAGATAEGASVDGLGPPLDRLAAVLGPGGGGLVELLRATERRLLGVASAHGPALARHAATTLEAGGKRLRPALVFLCAGEPEGERLVRAGTAVELVHMATLVHDDVVDRAPLRRGRPTVFVEGGREAAVATGDLLFSRAFAELVPTGSADGVRALSSACSALARGELMQRADAWSWEVTRERYLERCELKTARLFEAACRLGAVLGGAGGDRALEPLARFGSDIGLAFQILDDVLDVSGPTERTGKHRGTDLLDGTVTLPLILARERDPDLRELDLRAEVVDAAGAEAVCERIAVSGALVAARDKALAHVARAKAALAGAELGTERRRVLELVADGVVERYA
jgi:geranylgeranyl pyrophosphate synthase